MRQLNKELYITRDGNHALVRLRISAHIRPMKSASELNTIRMAAALRVGTQARFRDSVTGLHLTSGRVLR